MLLGLLGSGWDTATQAPDSVSSRFGAILGGTVLSLAALGFLLADRQCLTVNRLQARVIPDRPVRSIRSENLIRRFVGRKNFPHGPGLVGTHRPVRSEG